jgi:hypothetical protein
MDLARSIFGVMDGIAGESERNFATIQGYNWVGGRAG